MRATMSKHGTMQFARNACFSWRWNSSLWNATVVCVEHETALKKAYMNGAVRMYRLAVIRKHLFLSTAWFQGCAWLHDGYSKCIRSRKLRMLSLYGIIYVWCHRRDFVWTARNTRRSRKCLTGLSCYCRRIFFYFQCFFQSSARNTRQLEAISV
jgi:hypothetical protein